MVANRSDISQHALRRARGPTQQNQHIDSGRGPTDSGPGPTDSGPGPTDSGPGPRMKARVASWSQRCAPPGDSISQGDKLINFGQNGPLWLNVDVLT